MCVVWRWCEKIEWFLSKFLLFFFYQHDIVGSIKCGNFKGNCVIKIFLCAVFHWEFPRTFVFTWWFFLPRYKITVNWHQRIWSIKFRVCVCVCVCARENNICNKTISFVITTSQIMSIDKLRAEAQSASRGEVMYLEKK